MMHLGSLDNIRAQTMRLLLPQRWIRFRRQKEYTDLEGTPTTEKP